MRIAVISTPFVAVPPRDYGGTELVVHELVEGLVERGHDVTLFATGDSRTSAELRSLFPEARWPPGAMADLSHICWAMREVQQGRYDVVHANSAVALAVGRLVPKVPLVYTIHHARDADLSAHYLDHPRVQYVAISADQQQREVPLPRCEVIHHGLRTADYRWRRRAGPYLCFIGRLAQVKGAHTAIDAARLAGLPIAVCGGVHPPDRDYARRELHERLAQPHVRYLSVVGMDVKVPLLREARALLAPIEWNEPFGLILIEAMLSGCPVVAFRRGSVPELVEEGITGYMVDTVEEMVAIVRPGSAMEDFDRARCRARAVERFSRERMVADHERLYQKLVRPAPRRSAEYPLNVV